MLRVVKNKNIYMGIYIYIYTIYIYIFGQREPRVLSLTLGLL